MTRPGIFVPAKERESHGGGRIRCQCRGTNRRRKEYGGLKVEQAKGLKALEKENTRLKRLVAELSLEKQVFKDVAEENF